MSWAEEDWTVGLSGRVLQKVKELQVHHERLSRENKQKQLQLDNIHTSLEKQTVKYDEVRAELLSVQRELQRVQDEAKAAVTTRERLSQELHTKQAQVCSFEGQLDAARTLNNKLTQEVKRLEAELEKLQNSSLSADTTLFSTPCWNSTSPWEHNGSRKEERTGIRDEGQRQIRQRLQFSEAATASLPRQQHRNTPQRHLPDQSDSFSTPSAVFPWEREDSRPAARRSSPPSPQTPSASVRAQGQTELGVCTKEPRTEADSSVSALRSRVSALEGELQAKAAMLKSIQSDMVQSKKELSAKELSIQRGRDELSMAHTRMAQESERASTAEQRLKQVQEELKCQRQNAESSRLQHQQRSKELERQHQRDLTELQKERQCLEKQHQQEVNKLNQELQQARTLHNALQAQADKLSLQKQTLDKELETLKQKLKWTEGQLQESQKKEAQTQLKLTEAVRQAEGVAVSLEQSRKRERALEDEGRRLAEERADALRLLKELQEQKAAPVTEAVQFCPLGQSFSPQPSYSPHPRPPAHIRKPTSAVHTEQRSEEEVNKRRADTSYPSDREPGEGIDSEHITVLNSPNSEGPQRQRRCRTSNEEESKAEVIRSDISETSKHTPFDRVLSCSSHSAAGTSSPASVDEDDGMSAEKRASLAPGQASEDLRRENATLRSELRDVRDELQKRLEDLEAQRRAEAEARTRLKQLSRKHSSQSMEKQEQEKEWRAQLESEKAEAERLRKALAALETEIKRKKEEKEKNKREEGEEEENKNRALEDQETEMIELNIQLKKQLSEVKAQLALEREEKQREEQQRNQIAETDGDVKKELSLKLEELQAELEELKLSRKDASSEEEEKLSAANSPLTYLTLTDDELNSRLPSPEQHLLFCQSTNHRNVLASQQTQPDLIQEEHTLPGPLHSPQLDSELPDSTINYLLGSSPSLPGEEPVSSDLAKEVKRLQKENAKEAQRANHNQLKLEALQNQVTRQTQQLTMAFEKQSQHISGLLAELQEKEGALLSQAEELQRYKQELDAFKAQREAEEGENQVQKEEAEISGPQTNQERECDVTSLAPTPAVDSDSNAQEDAVVTAEPTQCSGEQLPNSTLSTEEAAAAAAAVMVDGPAGDRGGSDALQQENQLLRQTADSSSTDSHAHSGDQKDSAEQNQRTVPVALSPSVLSGLTTETQQSQLQDVRTSQDGAGDAESEASRTMEADEEVEAAYQLQLQHLQQQVVELQMRVRSLSEETQQQACELAVWRLASQPAPTFDQLSPSTDTQWELQDQVSAVTQSEVDEGKQAQAQSVLLYHEEKPATVTILREDEILLSCSTDKLHGRMLFSRLQHSNLPEPKTHPASKKTPAPQYDEHTDMDSEKENQEINLFHQSNICPAQHKEKDSDIIQVSSEKTGQQHVSLHPPGPKQSRAGQSGDGRPQTKAEASRTTTLSRDSSDRDVRTQMKSVGSQTEESSGPSSAPRAPQLHCASTQTEKEEEEEEEEIVESPSVSPVLGCEGAALEDKILFSGSFPIPADPVRLAERIRRNRTQLSAAFDDTEYEPYGLPEVVMKGFADIPTGPSCPYIVRRGLLGTAVVPAPQKNQDQAEETD